MSARILLAATLAALSFAASADDHDDMLEAIATTIDGFHDAAARGDKAQYLNLMTEDAAFLGTDEWERWPKQPEFTDYVGGRFQNGSGWTYRSVDRNIAIAESNDIAWFDEVIESGNNDRFRGTGVLVKDEDGWKIAHYAMSFLIFNEDWSSVMELTRKTREDKAREQENGE